MVGVESFLFMPSPKKNKKRKMPKADTLEIQNIPLSQKRKFQKRLLCWYEKYGRDLPWRRTGDPYKILVSEVMLQQTQVDRVIPKFHEFLQKYPTIRDLAEARPEEIRKTWYPLGYNIRPYRLHGIACEAMERYGGNIPSKEKELLSMKGIGRYTAGAIQSFAFQKDAAILDTNVMRVLHRIFIGTGEPKKQKSILWMLSKKLIPKGKGYDFNQGLMDFGAMVCTARKPFCLLCPMRDICRTVSSHE